MKFVLLNFRIANNKLAEKAFDEVFAKDLAYGSKTKEAQTIFYSAVAIPKTEERIEDEIYYQIKSLFLGKPSEDSIDALRAILNIDLNELKILSISEKIKEFDSKNCDVFFSDGSFRKEDSASSYGVCSLLEEDESGGFCQFLNEKRSYKTFSGLIENGTNNIGELSGIKIVTENFGNNLIQIVVSDSIYCIKAFREWYYSWKQNDFRNYAGKKISNEDLIRETFENIQNSGKIVLFKWVKGHKGDYFNEECDKLAKKELGILK